MSTQETKPIQFKTNNQNMSDPQKILEDPTYAKRIKIARRAAQEIEPNSYINLGIGIPTLVPMFISKEENIIMHGENGILGMDGYPNENEEDPDLIDPGKETIKVIITM